MAMFDDQKRKEKRALKRKDGTLPPPVLSAPQLAPITTMRVRILRRIMSRRFGTHAAGESVEFPVAMAKDLINMGLAEQDKSLDGSPETK